MPRIDPITGVSVMTLPEFFNAEAEHEGKGRSGGDVMAEMFDEMDQEMAQQLKRLLTPEGALEELKRAVGWWLEVELREQRRSIEAKDEARRKHKKFPQYLNYDWENFKEEFPPFPIKVVEVITAQYGFSLNSERSGVTAIAEVEGGGRILFETRYSHYSGSRMEPPEEQVFLQWHFVNPAGRYHTLEV